MSRLARVARRILAAAPPRPRHRLHAVRFRRLAEGVRGLEALSADAAEKLGGEWILDRSYATTLGQRALELGRSIVFDSCVLCGEDPGPLLARLDAVRGRVEARLAGEGSAEAAPAPDEEEPEYRLLREVLQIVGIGEAVELPAVSSEGGEGGLAAVVAEAHEAALRSFETLRHGTWGRKAGRPLRGPGTAGLLRVVDVGGGTASPRAGGWGPDLEWADIRCAPLRALIGGWAEARASEESAPEHFSSALAVATEECVTLGVRRPRETLLLDACLGDGAEANVVYVALRGEGARGPHAVGDVVAAEGFRVASLGPGLTAWLDGRGPGETRRVLEGLGEALGSEAGEAVAARRRPEGEAASPGAAGRFSRRGRA